MKKGYHSVLQLQINTVNSINNILRINLPAISLLLGMLSSCNAMRGTGVAEGAGGVTSGGISTSLALLL